MKMNITKIDDNRRVVLGKVTNVDSNDDYVKITLEGKVWNKEIEDEETKTLSIRFVSNDQTNWQDRFEKAKVEPGAILAVLVYEKDEKCYGNRFMYRGHWNFPEEDGRREKNIFMGTVASAREINAEDGSLRGLSVSVPVKVPGQEDPDWKHLAFWNSDTSNVATRASRNLTPKEDKKRRAVIVCGAARENNGYTNYSAFDFATY